MNLAHLIGRMEGRAQAWQRMIATTTGDVALRTGLLASCALDLVWYLFRPASRPAPIVYVSGIVEIRPSANRRIRFFIRRASDDLYSCSPGREGEVEDTIIGLLRPGDVFLDVGANVGYYSILASRVVGDSGLVIAIEPIAQTLTVLDTNLALNDVQNVRVVRQAAWSTSKPLYALVPRAAFGLASVSQKSKEGRVPVESTTLDEICTDLPRVRLIKVDVEGTEDEVLLGARETLEKTDHLVVEVTGDGGEARKMLAEFAFQIKELRFKPYIHASRTGSHAANALGGL